MDGIVRRMSNLEKELEKYLTLLEKQTVKKILPRKPSNEKIL